MGIDSQRYDDYAKGQISSLTKSLFLALNLNSDEERLKIRKMKLDADAKEAEILANTGLNSISEE